MSGISPSEAPEPLHLTSSYDYALPEDLVAQEPAPDRSGARLLHIPRDAPPGRVRDLAVPDLKDLLRPGDLLVVNETRVVPARFFGIRAATGGRAEVLLLTWDAPRIELLLSTRGHPEPGEEILLDDGAFPIVLESRGNRGAWVARTDRSRQQVRASMERSGRVPLPPYIKRSQLDARDAADRLRYQTVFARHAGAVAAPTAGLHLTLALLAELEAAGVERTAVTLHVGIGTFRPVRTEDLREHPMHEERYQVPKEAAAAVAACRARGGRIVPVGTTAVRVLESASNDAGELLPGEGTTRLFIHPPHRFRLCDALLTNFHAPRSTLLMLVSALAGRDRILAAYDHAVAQRYRFLSYGDAMFIA